MLFHSRRISKPFTTLFITLIPAVVLLPLIRADDDCCDSDVSSDYDYTLRYILASHDNPSLQIQALRRRLLERALDNIETDGGAPNDVEPPMAEEKRSLSSLAQSGELRGKRNLAALARAGLLSSGGEDAAASTAANEKEVKLTIDKQVKSTNDQLVSTDNFRKNGGGGRGQRKRAVWFHPQIRKILVKSRKRNLANMARMRSQGGSAENKRNIGSVNRGRGYDTMNRNQRSADDYDDYDQLLLDFDEPSEDVILSTAPEKRFMGRLPRMSKTVTTPAPKYYR